MNRTWIVAGLAVALLGVMPVDRAEAEEFVVDPGHSAIEFGVAHFGVSETRGRFDEFSGGFDMGEGLELSFEVLAESINTNSEPRDNHLRSGEFFDVANHPTITFESTGSEANEDGWAVSGDVTLLGVTQPVTVQVVKIGEGDTQYGYRAGLKTELVILRSEFGMTTGVDNGSVGDEVTLTITIEGIKQ